MNRPAARLGFGTHRSGPAIAEIVCHALAQGCHVFDTAPNYLAGQAQKALGSALAQTAAAHVRVMSKVGFMSGSEQRVAGPRFALVGNHCLDKAYIEERVRANIEDLGGRALDVLFLHNPEVQIARLQGAAFERLFSEAIEVCEALRVAGLTRSYGVATWNGLWEHLSVSRMMRLVESAAGQSHGFAALQSPVSLVRCETAREACEERGPLYEAKQLGIEIFASAPLHGGALAGPSMAALARRFGREADPAVFAVQFVRSTPVVDTVLFSTANTEHFDSIFALDERDPMSVENWLAVLEAVH